MILDDSTSRSYSIPQRLDVSKEDEVQANGHMQVLKLCNFYTLQGFFFSNLLSFWASPYVKHYRFRFFNASLLSFASRQSL